MSEMKHSDKLMLKIGVIVVQHCIIQFVPVVRKDHVSKWSLTGG